MNKLQRRWLAVFIFALTILMLPAFSPYDPAAMDHEARLSAPNIEHPFGTDLLGRDVLSRFLHGGQRTLAITLSAAMISFLCGAFIGILQSQIGWWGDLFIQPLLNAILSFPGLAAALIVLALLGTGEASIMIAVAVIQIAPCAKVTYSAIIVVREQEFTLAARALGGSNGHVLLRHILPNAASTLLFYFGTTFSFCLLSSAALMFLGFGGDPSIADWGVMLNDGRTTFRDAPWVAFFPGIAITLTNLFVTWVISGATALPQSGD